MTYREWVLKEFSIDVDEFPMPLPTLFIKYKEYCKEHEIEEDWYN